MKCSVIQKIYLGFFVVLVISVSVYLTIDCCFINRNCFSQFSVSSFLNGYYQKNINESFNKNICIYRPLKFVKTHFDMAVGKSFADGIYIKDSSLIQIPQLPSSYDLRNVAKKVNEFRTKIDQSVYSLIITTKSQIDNDKFISYVFKNDESKIISEYNDCLNNNIYKLDAITPLTYIKGMDAFYKTDSRLTGLGSFLVYNYNIKQLGASPFSMKQFDVEHVVSDFYGELYDKVLYSNIDSDIIDLFHFNAYSVDVKVDSIYSDTKIYSRSTIYDLSQKTSSDKINVVFGEAVPIREVTTNSKSKNSILIFADRNIDALIQFLAIHYSKITVVNLSEFNELGDTLKNSIKKINSTHYDQVLFGYGIESLRNTYQFDHLKKFNLS